MIPGVATHGYWCNSRTYPMRCKYCGERVFYFTCDHGCKVFFEELGGSWPIHKCFERWIAEYGKEFIERGFATMMMTPGMDIRRRVQSDYASKVEESIAKEQTQILRNDPYPNAKVQEDGIVRELIAKVNLFKRLKIPQDSALGAAMLGELAKNEFAQITIHTGSLAGGDNFSYTFLVERKLVERRGIIKGDFVSCELRGVALPNSEPVWVCDKLRGMFE